MERLLHGLLFLLLATGFVSAAFMHGTMCRVCDSQDSSARDDCIQTHNKKHKVCADDYNNCLTRYEMTSNGMRITKSCATNSTCIDQWWLNSSSDDQCKPQNFAGGANAVLPNGKACSYCCRASTISSPYCNDGDMPSKSDLVSFTDVSVAPALSTSASQETTEAATVEDTSTSTATSTTPTTESTSTTTVTSVPQAPSNSSLYQGSYAYGQPMQCSTCTLTRSHSTCQDPSIMCKGDTPLCMTSFFDDGMGNLVAQKRCASITQCDILWWRSTRPRDDCMSDTPDPFAWSGTKAGECHYCCVTSPGLVNDWCNRAPWPTKPKSLVNMTDYINGMSPKTDAPTTVSTTDLTTNTVATATKTDAKSTTAIDTDTTILVSSTDTVPTVDLSTKKDTRQTTEAMTTDKTDTRQTTEAMTTDKADTTQTTEAVTTDKTDTMQTTAEAITTDKANTTQTRVETSTYKTDTTHTTEDLTTNKADTTQTHVGLTTVKADTTQTLVELSTDKANATPTTEDLTTDNADTTQTPVKVTTDKADTTNTDMVTNRNNDETTTLGSQSNSVDTTQALQSTTQAKITTAQPAASSSRKCVQCGDITSGVPCGALQILLGEIKQCPPGLDYCMNDISQNGNSTTRSVFKRCVTLDECKDKWFAETSDNPKCTTYNPSISTTTTDLDCHYCCTTDGCNKPYKPADSTLWIL